MLILLRWGKGMNWRKFISRTPGKISVPRIKFASGTKALFRIITG